MKVITRRKRKSIEGFLSSTQFFRFLGFAYADGCFYEDYVKFDLSVRDIEYLLAMSSLFYENLNKLRVFEKKSPRSGRLYDYCSWSRDQIGHCVRDLRENGVSLIKGVYNAC